MIGTPVLCVFGLVRLYESSAAWFIVVATALGLVAIGGIGLLIRYLRLPIDREYVRGP